MACARARQANLMSNRGSARAVHDIAELRLLLARGSATTPPRRLRAMQRQSCWLVHRGDGASAGLRECSDGDRGQRIILLHSGFSDTRLDRASAARRKFCCAWRIAGTLLEWPRANAYCFVVASAKAECCSMLIRCLRNSKFADSNLCDRSKIPSDIRRILSNPDYRVADKPIGRHGQIVRSRHAAENAAGQVVL
jgi:hypothetical protein